MYYDVTDHFFYWCWAWIVYCMCTTMQVYYWCFTIKYHWSNKDMQCMLTLPPWAINFETAWCFAYRFTMIYLEPQKNIHPRISRMDTNHDGFGQSTSPATNILPSFLGIWLSNFGGATRHHVFPEHAFGSTFCIFFTNLKNTVRGNSWQFTTPTKSLPCFVLRK